MCRLFPFIPFLWMEEGGGGVLKTGIFGIILKNLFLPHFLCAFIVKKGIYKKGSLVAAKHTTNLSMSFAG